MNHIFMNWFFTKIIFNTYAFRCKQSTDYIYTFFWVALTIDCIFISRVMSLVAPEILKCLNYSFNFEDRLDLACFDWFIVTSLSTRVLLFSFPYSRLARRGDEGFLFTALGYWRYSLVTKALCTQEWQENKAWKGNCRSSWVINTSGTKRAQPL